MTQPPSRYPFRDRERLAAASDEELEDAVVEHVVRLFSNDYRREFEVVISLTPGMRMVYTTWVLEMEVNNGGFVQYFYNQDERLAPLTFEGYELLGTPLHAQVLSQALQIYAREKSVLQQFWSKDRHEGGAQDRFAETYEHTGLTGLDEPFYSAEMQEDTSRLRIDHIRGHPDEFVVPPDLLPAPRGT